MKDLTELEQESDCWIRGVQDQHDSVVEDEKKLNKDASVVMQTLENYGFSQKEKDDISNQLIKLPFGEYKELENNQVKLQAIFESISRDFGSKIRENIRENRELILDCEVVAENCSKVKDIVDPIMGGFGVEIRHNFVGEPYFNFYYKGEDLFGDLL